MMSAVLPLTHDDTAPTNTCFSPTNEDIISAQTVDQTSSYIDAIYMQLQSFLSLETNWDSYGALTPTTTALIGSGYLASELLNDSTPVPDIFPVPNGHIQFEWSNFGYDIEIEIESMNKCYVIFENMDTGEHWEKTFTYDLTELSQIISALTTASLAQQQPQPLRIIQ